MRIIKRNQKWRCWLLQTSIASDTVAPCNSLICSTRIEHFERVICHFWHLGHTTTDRTMTTENFDVYFARAAALYRLQSVEQSTTELSNNESAELTSSGNHGGGDQSLRPPRRSCSCKYPAGSRRRRLSPKGCLRGAGSDDSIDEVHVTTKKTSQSGSGSASPARKSPPCGQLASASAPSMASMTGLLPNVVLLAADAEQMAGRPITPLVGACCVPGLIGMVDRIVPGGRAGGPCSAAGGSTSPGTSHGQVVRRTCSSAPHSRSSSWRKSRRQNESLLTQQNQQQQQQHSSTGVSLEAEVIEKLRQLKLMQVKFKQIVTP